MTPRLAALLALASTMSAALGIDNPFELDEERPPPPPPDPQAAAAARAQVVRRAPRPSREEQRRLRQRIAVDPSAPVVFLDFDGVLNHEALFRARPALRSAGRLIHDPNVLGLNSIDPVAVGRVDRLCQEAGARVVVSSSWRNAARPTQSRLRILSALRYHGFRGVVSGITPEGARRSGGRWLDAVRGAEIQAWLDAQAVKPRSFVILDDESDMAHLAPFLVQTDSSTGLLDEHVERALAVLRGGAS